jgi:hypothetical protein
MASRTLVRRRGPILVEEIDELHVSASLCDRALVAGARDRLSGRLPEPLGVSAVR